MTISKFQVLMLAAAISATACAQTDDDAEGTPADSSVVGNADSLNTGGNSLPTEPVVTKLDDVNNSGVEGEATATHSAQEATVSILLKDGAQANTDYPAHIHTGTCETGGPVAVELEPVKNLQSTKTIQVSALPQGQPLFIQVHGKDGKPVACGNMKGHEGDDATHRANPNTTTSSY